MCVQIAYACFPAAKIEATEFLASACSFMACHIIRCLFLFCIRVAGLAGGSSWLWPFRAHRGLCVFGCVCVRVFVLYAGLVARHGLAFSSSPQLNVKHHYVTIWLKLMLELINLTY